jgi:DNA helicase-2/ATP-dependent DNA helicase PcrA
MTRCFMRTGCCPELLKFYQEKYRYICVDEAQDTSKIQHIIIGLLAGEQGNLFMVGDEDQSIYGFRAAYPEALLNFTKEHPGAKELVMDQNYRSNARIVADHFIQHNKLRHRKHMVPTKAEEEEIHYISLKNRSAQYTYLRKVAQNHKVETAVLYRDNESVLPLIDQLERQQIPYRIKSTDMAFFTHRVVTDVTNIMRFALNPYDTELFLRIYFKCQTYLKKNQAQQLCRISEERHIPVLEAAEYAEGLNGMVLGKCRAFATHLRNMLKEAPSRGLFRIETPLGYGEYLERNNMDDNKLFILKMLSYEEVSIGSFLGRLEYLQNMLREKRPDYDSNFILSTIHSSKGLEYEEVYLMDVCDGVFPDKVVYSRKATPQEKKEFEEERRLFYVGMTRAKSVLHIFRLSEETSSFIREMMPVKVEGVEGVKQDSLKFPDRMKLQNEKRVEGKTFAALQPDQGKMKLKPKSLETDPGGHGTEIQLVIGERVEQIKYGMGVISDAVYHADGITGKFTVIFDSGLEKNFLYPVAFQMGMRIVTEEETGKEGQA